MLSEHGVRVWVDDSEIRLGDSVRRKIEEGLAESQFGAVVLSPNFFRKAWANAELSALFARQMAESRVLLPIWHCVTFDAVREASPLLADIRAALTDNGISAVAQQLYQTIQRAEDRYRPGAPTFAGRLTKRVLMSMADNSVLVSNCYGSNMEPRLLVHLPSAAGREAVWRQIRESGLAGTRFYVFADIAEYRVHVATRFVDADEPR